MAQTSTIIQRLRRIVDNLEEAVTPKKRLVVIESPLSPRQGRTLEDHVAYAQRALADSLARGEAPFASHLIYPQALDDAIPEQRREGILAGFAWGEVADLVAVYSDFGVTPGMREGILRAKRHGQEVSVRYIGREDG